MFGIISEINQYRSMLWSLTKSDLRTRYKGSALGFLWTFVNPLLMLLVYVLIFSFVMKINLPHYSVFMFIGLLAWNMFAMGIQTATGSVIAKANLVNKIYFPREILPLSVVLGALVNYLLSMVIMFVFLIISGFAPTWVWLYFPLIVLLETILTLGFALLFASLNVFFRDLEHMLGVLLMLWFYLTPIIYPITMIPKHFSYLLKLNPVTSIVLSYQDIFYYGTAPHWKLGLYGVIFSLLLLALGSVVFHTLSRRFAEEV